MISSDERPDQRGDESEVSFSTLDAHDLLVRAFQEFLISETSKRGLNQTSQVVADFSRRVTFLQQHLGHDLRSDDVVALLVGLNDAKMAEMALDSVNSEEGRNRLKRTLQARPYPHYATDPSNPSLLVRIARDGTRTLGRFVNQEFVAADNG